MRKPWIPAAALLLLCVVQPGSRGYAAQPETGAPDPAVIRKALDVFAAAFNRADARELADRFTANAEYTDENGALTRGRAAIQRQIRDRFSGTQGLRMTISGQSVRFVRPDVATARGTTTVTAAGGGSASGTFSALLVKEEGDWKIDSLQESVWAPAPSASEALEQLDWMIGTWTDGDENTTVRTVCEWAKNHTFITRSFKAFVDGKIDLEGTQVIGWDPAAGRIRSWVFDSDGGFSEEVWSRQGNRWTITSSGVLPDGSRASAVNILTRVDDKRCTWESTERDHGGELLPDVKSVTLVRQAVRAVTTR